MCNRSFSGVDDLIEHVKKEHSGQIKDKAGPVGVEEIDVPCKCDRISCGGMNFRSTKLLMTHYNGFHGNEERPCIFAECKTEFHAACPNSARNHFRIKHKQTGKLKLKSLCVLNQGGSERSLEIANVPQEPEDVNGDLENDIYEHDELESLDQEIIESASLDDSDGDYYLQYYSDWLNRLAHFKFIPQSTIQEIAEEHLLNTKQSLEKREKVLRKSLTETGALDENTIENIVKDVFKNDPYLQAQGMLNTEFKRTKYIHENPNFVAPQEVLLNKREVIQGSRRDVLHYVSMVESFKTLVQDKSFCKMIEQKVDCVNDEKIKDIKDGHCYKSNKYFQENPEAYGAILYSDAIELKGSYHF